MFGGVVVANGIAAVQIDLNSELTKGPAWLAPVDGYSAAVATSAVAWFRLDIVLLAEGVFTMFGDPYSWTDNGRARRLRHVGHLVDGPSTRLDAARLNEEK